MTDNRVVPVEVAKDVANRAFNLGRQLSLFDRGSLIEFINTHAIPAQPATKPDHLQELRELRGKIADLKIVEYKDNFGRMSKEQIYGAGQMNVLMRIFPMLVCGESK